VDQTSLTGLYDIKLQWTPDPLAGAPPVEPNGPSIFAAIQEQLGLRLVSSRGPSRSLCYRFRAETLGELESTPRL